MSGPSSVGIVGSGLGGWRTASQLRTLGYDGGITLYGDEGTLPYDRPPLSKTVLSGDAPAGSNQLTTDQELEQLNIEFLPSAEVHEVQAGRVQVAGQGARRHGALVIATGASARTAPPALEHPRLRYLRRQRDADVLSQALEASQSILVLGGGFIGAEVAAAARLRGLDVTIVEALPTLLHNALGPQAGARAARLHTDAGVGIISGAKAERTLPSDKAIVVELSNGSVLEADFALAGFGAVPNVNVAGAGFGDVTNGILCDHNGRTAVPGVWAVGDVSAWWDEGAARRARREHWSSAGDQASLVAYDILGKPAPEFLRLPPYIWSDQYQAKIQLYGRPELADGGGWLHADGAGPDDVFGYTREGGLVAVATFGGPRLLAKFRSHVINNTAAREITVATT